MDDARRAPTEPGNASQDTRQHASGQTALDPSRHHRSHSPRTRRHPSTAEQLKSRHWRQRLLLRSMAAAIVVLCLAAGLLCALLLRTRRELGTARQQLDGQIREEQRKTELGAAEVKRLGAQLRELVNGRLPNPLLEMVPDQLIPVEPAPLRNILFTQVGAAERPGYEYKLTCRNEGPARFRPRVRILLFNEAGIQTGSADLSDSSDATRLGGAGLAAGESASFSGRVTQEFDDAPKYFMVLSLDPGGKLPRLSR